ncbi:MAG TPA: hypothetical protein VNE58_08815 [Casimicrobiaceae bacterium]|nr:hypothetical protein [Casimicrobiaceae bacterium]
MTRRLSWNATHGPVSMSDVGSFHVLEWWDAADAADPARAIRVAYPPCADDAQDAAHRAQQEAQTWKRYCRWLRHCVVALPSVVERANQRNQHRSEGLVISRQRT